MDLRASHGAMGTLLLDPTTLIITGGSGDGAADGNSTFTGNPSGTAYTLLYADTGPTTVYESELEGATANIVLEASRTITTSGTFTSTQVLLPSNINLTMRTRNTAGDGVSGIDLTASTDGVNLEFKT